MAVGYIVPDALKRDVFTVSELGPFSHRSIKQMTLFSSRLSPNV